MFFVGTYHYGEDNADKCDTHDGCPVWYADDGVEGNAGREYGDTLVE